MYVLEIETKNELIKIKNPKKARFVDRIFWDVFQILDNDGNWNKILLQIILEEYVQGQLWKISRCNI